MAEAVNILKHGIPLEPLINLILGLFMLNNVKIMGVNKETCFAVVELGRNLKPDQTTP